MSKRPSQALIDARQEVKELRMQVAYWAEMVNKAQPKIDRLRTERDVLVAILSEIHNAKSQRSSE